VAARGVQPPVAGELGDIRHIVAVPRGRLGRGRAESAATVADVGSADSVRIRETPGLAMGIIDLQRRQPGPRAEQPRDRLQAAVANEKCQRRASTGSSERDRARALERRARAGGRTRHGGGAWPSSATIGPIAS